MNKIVEGRNQPPPPKPPCDHYSVRSHGQIICSKCQAVWNLGLKGPVWVEHDA